ncbi:MAG: galactokinase [Armatimonadetes bacterium]|nr:galactokinase [Armatimonadota bacterium]
MHSLLEQAARNFRSEFGKDATHLSLAPGRANLIGEHTDYHDGFVFPIAIDRYVAVAARVTDGPTRISSSDRGTSGSWDVKTMSPPGKGWESYAVGMAWALTALSGRSLPNVEAAVVSNLPIGSGLSSSAAIEMAFGVLWRELGAVSIEDIELALAGQKVENEFVGMRCGIMDQTASIMGREHMAMKIDTRLPISVQHALLPDKLSVVICDTHVRHQHTGSGYNDRRRESEEAASILGVNKLRDANLEMLETFRSDLGDIRYRRARHIITENLRVEHFQAALDKGDIAALAPLMRSAHNSIRFDFEASCPELDIMAELAWNHPRCAGARMTGGGFGGSCVALVYADSIADFQSQVAAEYLAKTGIQSSFHVCTPSDGARTISVS